MNNFLDILKQGYVVKIIPGKGLSSFLSEEGSVFLLVSFPSLSDYIITGYIALPPKSFEDTHKIAAEILPDLVKMTVMCAINEVEEGRFYELPV